MIKKLEFVFISILFSLTTLSQEISIKSQILDNETGLAIPYANIFIQRTGKGTVSNKEGIFTLFASPNDEVQIRFLGYQTKIIVAKQIEQQLKLSALAYNLDEITIYSKNIITNPKEIIKKSIEEAPKFKPETSYLCSVFIRQNHLLNKNYIKHIEAALNCYFIPKKEQWNVNVSEKRNSTDNRTIDPKELYQIYQISNNTGIRKAVNKSYRLLPPQNELNKLIPIVDQRQFPISKSLNYCSFSYCPNLKVKRNLRTLFKQQEFKIDTIIPGEKENYYKIKILPTKKELRKYPFITIGYLLISTADFAIHEVEIAKVKSPRDKKGLTSLITGNGIQSKIKIRYQKLNGKLYPSYCYEYGVDWVASNNLMAFSGKYPYITREMVFAQNIFDQKQISKLIPQTWNDNLYLEQEYHKEFWNHFPSLSETKDETSLRGFLEAQIKLKNIKTLKK